MQSAVAASFHLGSRVVSVVYGRDEPSHDEDLPLDGGHAGLLDAVGQGGRVGQPPPAAEQVAGSSALFHPVPILGRICRLYTTVETAYKVYICPRGNLLYMRIYLITNLKLL